MMFIYKDKEYELRFTIKRADLIEQAMGKSIMAACVASDRNGLMTLQELKAFFCLRLEGSRRGIFSPGR